MKKIKAALIKPPLIGHIPRGTGVYLDNLYEVLKERKNLKLSTISKAYGVENSVVMSWGKALETANLIMVDYPIFGEPNFVYKDEK